MIFETLKDPMEKTLWKRPSALTFQLVAKQAIRHQSLH